MASGVKSNGTRRVNKTDGLKKRGKKQMTKSRRVDSKEESQDEGCPFDNYLRAQIEKQKEN